MKDRNNNTKYVKLMGFSNEANIVVNKAIRLAEKYKCEHVDITHVLLALINKENSNSFSIVEFKELESDIMNEYAKFAKNGAFGKLDGDNINLTPDYFSGELYILCSIAAQDAYMRHETVTCEDLYIALLDILCNMDGFENCILMRILNNLGITREDLSNMLEDTNSMFYIPEEISDFVEDINTSSYIKDKLIYGVDSYVDDVIEILSRKYKANPCLVGNAGVGKTSIVYRLVQKILANEVPEEFEDAHVCYINGSVLTAGTKYRGEFEMRMKMLMNWASENNVILFLDEIHSFINSGKSSENSFDTAGNMIKKYLSDGSIKIIGATTYEEYHKSVEQDSAFNRRLQKIDIKEPSVENTINMIKDSLMEYTMYHGVNVEESLLENLVNLCNRYIKDQYFPDKAYSILDQVCAKAKLQSKKEVDEELLLSVISKNTGIDITKLKNSDRKSLLNLENTISKNLIGQENAIKTVCKAIRRAKAGVREENKPLASFLFVGPTGVGKTELCKVLSREIGLSKESFIKVDMSEFSEKSSISKFIGSAPGYVGYGEGGQLTEKVKHNPYSLVLFDEIEKAHPEIFNSLLQLLDEGRLTDGQGQTVDFTNCIVVMTSNAGYGADIIGKKKLGFGITEDHKDYREAERVAIRELESTFRPELLNRIDNIVIFDKLNKEQCNEIVKLLLNKLSNRLLEEHNIIIKFNTSVIEHITEHGYSDKYGARNLRREIQDTVEDIIADAIISEQLTKNCKCSISYTKQGIKIKKSEEK